MKFFSPTVWNYYECLLKDKTGIIEIVASTVNMLSLTLTLNLTLISCNRH